MKYTLIITVILVFAKALWIIPFEIPSVLYFGWFSILGIIIATKSSIISNWSIVLVCAAFISLIFNYDIIAPNSDPWSRLIVIIIMLLAIGPITKGQEVDQTKESLFKWINYVSIIVAIVSIFAKFIYPQLVYKITHNGAVFVGLYNFGMTLSPMAATASLFAINELAKINKNRIYLVIIIILCISSSLVGASRGAIGALIVGILFYLYFYYYGRIKKFLKSLLIIIFVLLCSTPIWIRLTEGLIQKQQSRTESANLLSGRDRMWEDRIKEIKYSPIIGIGFGNYYYSSNSNIDTKTGNIESGSGWLTALSNLGIIGIIPIVILFWGNIKCIARHAKRKEYDFILYSSLIVFFTIHSLIEGYIFGVGNPLFIMMWLSIAMINQHKYS